MARPRGVLSLYLCALLSLLTISVRVNAHAPGDPTLSQGLKPYGAYSGGDVDLVSFENGRLDLHIPLDTFKNQIHREHSLRVTGTYHLSDLPGIFMVSCRKNGKEKGCFREKVTSP